MYYVYALYNVDTGKIYIGQTEDLERRVEQHNAHFYKGFTARYPGEWKIIYSEEVSSRSQALKREKQLKSGNGRMYIKAFIPA